MEFHKGLALKLVNANTNVSSKEIINDYYRVIKRKGSAWYSTAIPVNSKRRIDKVLFIVFNGNKVNYVLADI